MRAVIDDIGLSQTLTLCAYEAKTYIFDTFTSLDDESCKALMNSDTSLFAVAVCLLPKDASNLFAWLLMASSLQSAASLYSSVYSSELKQINAIRLLSGLGAIIEIWWDHVALQCLTNLPYITAEHQLSMVSFLEHIIRSALYSNNEDSNLLKSLGDLDDCCHALGALIAIPTSGTSYISIQADVLQLLYSIIAVNCSYIAPRVISILLPYFFRIIKLSKFDATDKARVNDLLSKLLDQLFSHTNLTPNDYTTLRSSNNFVLNSLVMRYPNQGQCYAILSDCKWKSVRIITDIAHYSPSLIVASKCSTLIQRIIEDLEIHPTSCLPDILICLRSMIQPLVRSITEDELDYIICQCWKVTMSSAHVSPLVISAFIQFAFDESILRHSIVHLKYYDLITEYAKAERPHIMQTLVFHLISQWENDTSLCLSYVPRMLQILLYKEPRLSDNAKADLSTGDGTMVRLLLLQYLENSNIAEVSFIHQLQMLMQDLVKMNLKEEYVKQSMVGTELFGHKLRSWQSLCVLSRYATLELVLQIKESVFECLEQSCAHGIRVYMEIFVAVLLRKFTPQVLPILLSKLKRYNHPQQTLSSYFIILGHLILEEETDLLKFFEISKLEEVLMSLISWLSCANGLPRAIAQVVVQRLIPTIMPHLPPEDERISESLESILDYLSSNVETSKLMQRQLKFFHESKLEKRVLVDNLFRFKVEGDDDVVPPHLLDAITEFYKTYGNSSPQNVEEDIKICQANQDINALQTKRTTFEQLQLLLEDKFDMLSRNANGLKKQRIVVVASLIDKATNLAGIARTCEVFAVEKLWIADKRVVKSEVFQGISVSSETWLDIEEVKPSEIITALADYRLKGYSIIGLEQTDSSQSLAEFHWPDKSVLILGHEKEGISIELLQEIDNCLEIPQLGVIRSLNVHVSCALAIWEASKQFLEVK